MDVMTAFLNGQEESLMQKAEGIFQGDPELLCRLKKALMDCIHNRVPNEQDTC